MDKETADKMRGMVRRAVVKNIRDDGQMQTASVEVAEGVWRDNVEIGQHYGFSSSAPEDGALAVVLAIGGDEGDLLVLPVGNPSTRLGKQKPGDAGIYNQHGDKMVVTAAGAIEIMSGGSMRARIGGSTFTVTGDAITMTAGGVTVTISGGGLAIDGGRVTHNGVNIGSDHGHVSAPPGAPGPPVGG